MRENKLVFISACAGMLLFGISVITLGSVANDLREKFQIDAVSTGTLFSILPFGILTGSLIFGPFCDRYGYKFFLITSALCLFAGFQGIAFTSSMTMLKIYVFVFGFGGGAINGATNAVVSDISKDNKGADLSLLGIFYAIGALGMPFILGILKDKFSYPTVLSFVSYASILFALLFLFTKFPPPKQTQGFPLTKGFGLLKESFILLIAFFLLFQTSFEAIINNWTTTYLSRELSLPDSNALYALSLYVVGMAVMRLIIGSFLRKAKANTILLICFTLLITGSVLLQLAESFSASAAGLIAIGAGLSAGFPIMLGLIGNHYEALSGTAFSIVLFIALFGNMTINYIMGIIVDRFGIHHYTTICFLLWGVMTILALMILRKNKEFINTSNTN